MEQELFSTQEAATKLGIKNSAFRMRALRAGLEPAKTIQGKGSPQKFWTLEQINLIAQNARADVTETAGDTVAPSTAQGNDDELIDTPTEQTVTNISTIEPAPVVDTDTLITESLEGKTLEQLAREAISFISRGDECLKQGLTFYFAAGRRLNEAKKRVGHGNWQSWLVQNFPSSADTAENYMKLARRFSETKSEPIRNLGYTKLIRLLALPEGTEEEFIQEQAEKGTPLETQSARDVQKNVKAFKEARATTKETTEEPTLDLSNTGETFSIFGRNAEPDNNSTDTPTNDTNADSERVTSHHEEKVIEETAADDAAQFSIVTPEQIIALRELVTGTNDLHALKTIRDSLLELVQEVGKVVLLTEAKIGELTQKK